MRKRFLVILAAVSLVGAGFASFVLFNPQQSQQMNAQNKTATPATGSVVTVAPTQTSAVHLEAQRLSDALNAQSMQTQSSVMTSGFASAYLGQGQNMRDAVRWEIDERSFDAGELTATVKATAIGTDSTRTAYVFFLERSDAASPWLIASMQKQE